MKPSRAKAIELQCWACMGEYRDGKVDCECVRCPLYTWMPYAEMEPDLSLFDFSPRRRGRVTAEESSAIAGENSGRFRKKEVPQ
jgi:hypothetical protein